MSMALVVDGLNIRSRQAHLVHHVSFAVERGHSLTILGETGSGKSLVSQAIMGTLAAGLNATGTIVIDGVAGPATTPDRHRLWGRTLATLPQEPWRSLDPTMKAVDQVAEGYRSLSRRNARGVAGDALRHLGLGGAERHYPFMLSGGMAQRVTFAAATAAGADILLVDEPTKGLDIALRDAVVALLRAALAEGRTLVTITHDINVARALGGEVVIMLDGEIVEQGPAGTILSAPAHEYTRRLLAAEPAAWPARRPARTDGAAILTAHGLTKRYGHKTLFKDINVVIKAGECRAIVGPSGSGKTSFGDALLGLTPVDAGEVTRAPWIATMRFQKLYQHPTAAFAPRIPLGRALNDLISLHRLDPGRVAPMMAGLRLNPDLLQRRPDQVSGGELQRISLLRLLLLSPAFIFADEPTSQLDPITQQEVMDLLMQHVAEHDTALLLVTHDPAIGANVSGGLPLLPDHGRSLLAASDQN